MEIIKINYFLIILIVFSIYKINGQRIPINNVNIEGFIPRGLRISINYIFNSTHFELNANINKKINSFEVPQLTQSSNIPINEKWVVNFPDITVQPNDVIYFWFIVYVNNQPYRYNRSKIIRDKDMKFMSAPKTITINSEQCTCLSDFEIKRELELLKKQHETIRKELDYVKEVLYQVTKDTTTNKKLLLTGRDPPGFNAMQEARQFIIDKLKLYQFEYEIAQAEYTKCGILFEMDTEIQKKIILSKAGQLLKQSAFKVYEPTSYNCKENAVIENPGDVDLNIHYD